MAFYRLLILFIPLLIIGGLRAQNTDSITEVVFSKSGGFYYEPFEIKLDAGGETIFYTLDGSIPNNGSKRYSSPILIDTTKVIRAVYYKNGKKTDIVTQSYIYGRTFDMPVVSIVTNPDDFFSFDNGIYVKGCCADSVIPYMGANFWENWERIVNIEFFEPDGTLGFNQIAGIKIFGGYSKWLPMKSLAVYARKYDGKNFKHKIFPTLPFKKYKTFLLRNAGGDFNNCHFRDAMLTQLGKDIGQEIQEDRPAIVYINGEYWGIHHLREKINEHYVHDHFGVNKDSVDMMRHRKDLQNGNRKHYLAMVKFLERNNFNDPENIHKLDSLMDIFNYIDYNITEIFVDNRDAGGNIRYWRAKADTGKWRWILYDLDMTMGIDDRKAFKRNTLERMTKKNDELWPDPPWSTLIIRKILENDSLKHYYVNRFADLLNTTYSSKSVIQKINYYHDLLKYEMPYHIKKWDNLRLETWERNIDKIKDFAGKRPFYCRQHIIDRFNVGDTIGVQISDVKNGFVQLNSLTIDSSFYGIYFTLNEIHLNPKPQIGYLFSHWDINGTKDTSSYLNLNLNNYDSIVTIRPFFKRLEMSRWNKIIVINELNNKKDTSNGINDWIELYNSSESIVSEKNWTVWDGKRLLHFDINIPSKGYFILTRDTTTFLDKYPEIINYSQANIHFGKSDSIFILDNFGKVIDSLFYIKSQKEELLSYSRKNPKYESTEKSYDWVKSTPGIKNSNFIKIQKKEVKPTNYLEYLSLILIVIGILSIAGYFILRKIR